MSASFPMKHLHHLNVLMHSVENTAPYHKRVGPLMQRSYHIACIDLGEYMERVRKKTKHTASWTALALGVTLPHYRDMEKGNRRFLPIHIKTLMRSWPEFKRETLKLERAA